MERRNGPWTIKSSEAKFKNDFIEVIQDEVIRPDGKPGYYATVKMNRGVCILPVDENMDVIMTRQFRYVLQSESIEAVAGSANENEMPSASAERELKEELGIKAGELISLGVVDMDTSIVNCPVDLFLARQLEFSTPEQEGTESIKPYRISLQDAVDQVMNSRITHAPTCIIIMKTVHFLRSV